MRGLVSAEKFYRSSKNRKAALFIVILVVAAGLLAVFPVSLSNLRNTEAKSEIRSVLSKFSESYRNKDIQGIMTLYAEESGALAIGTGNEAQSVGHDAIGEAYRREFSEFGEIKSVAHKIVSLNISRDFASLAATRDITALEKDEMIHRTGSLTAVLKRIHGRWVFIQTHFSPPPE